MGDEAKGFWQELRRRRVVSSAAAYAAVAFVLLQLAEILFPAFGLGPDALRVLFALLLAGFPIALGFAWVFDVTASGLKRTAPAQGTGTKGSGGLTLTVLRLAAVLVSSFALGGLGWWIVQGGVETAQASTPAIAVLPFTDLSETGDQAYLGDGIAEEILNILAGVEGLQVAARTSSFAFRESGADAREIGDRLNVSTILEGSVRRDSARVRITAQLIDTEDGFHLWSDTFEREMDDLFTVQDEIAGAIVEALLGQLTVPGARTARHAVSPEAQDAYWRARSLWNRRDAVGIPAALRLFQDALAIDSIYPEAYAGLADSWALLPQFVSSVSVEEAWENGERWARRALELDPNLADAHASLGLVLAFRGDRADALVELARAIALNPSYAPAYHWRGNVLAELGLLEDARRDAERAARLDPLSPAIATDYGQILLWSGEPALADAEFARALSLEFGFSSALFGRALAALATGEEVALQMALAQWVAMSRIPMSPTSELANAMMAYSQSGVSQPVPEGLRVLANEPGTMDAGTVAALHALVGAKDEAMEWLRRSVQDRSWVNQYLRVNSVYEPFREDPEFRQILSAIAA